MAAKRMREPRLCKLFVSVSASLWICVHPSIAHARQVEEPEIISGSPSTDPSTQSRQNPENRQNQLDQPVYDFAEDLEEINQSLEDIDLFEMEVPVVVTASRQIEKVSTVPFAVSVVTADDIRKSGAKTVADALRLVPGVDVADLGSATYAIAPRGFHGFLTRQALVLIDGRQIFDSLFGGNLWASWPIQLEDIARIEVIRGPGGVTWGANAVNGVINIITKDPAEQEGLTITLGGGSRGWNKEHIGYGVVDGSWRFRLSGELESSDGSEIGGSLVWPMNDQFMTQRFGLHAIYEQNPDDTYTFSLAGGHMDGGYTMTPMGGLGNEIGSGSRANSILFKWTHAIEENNWFEVNAYINDFHIAMGYQGMDYFYEQVALQIGHKYNVLDSHKFSWGIDSRLDYVDGGLADPFIFREDSYFTSIVGLYLQDEWQFAPQWVLSMGVRVDYENYGGFEPSARASLAYTFDDHSMLYAACSRAFQAPPVGMRFIHLPGLNGIAYAEGKGTLSTEILQAYELGYRSESFKGFDTSINLFWHEFSRVTTLSPELGGPPGLLPFVLDNRAAASLYGIEWDGKWKVTDNLTLLAHHTFQDLAWNSSRPFRDKDVLAPPKHKAMLGVRCRATDDLFLSTHTYYVDSTSSANPYWPFSDRKVDPYVRLDLLAEHELFDDQMTIQVGVKNLLDENHYEGSSLFLNDAEIPRIFFAEMRVALTLKQD